MMGEGVGGEGIEWGGGEATLAAFLIRFINNAILPVLPQACGMGHKKV
jgi:hypothetical protein